MSYCKRLTSLKKELGTSVAYRVTELRHRVMSP